MIPKRGTSTFISSIGHLDGRIDLKYKADDFIRESSNNYGITMENNRFLMDLCIMASKLAYENAAVVEEVVLNYWKASILNLRSLIKFLTLIMRAN